MKAYDIQDSAYDIQDHAHRKIENGSKTQNPVSLVEKLN